MKSTATAKSLRLQLISRETGREVLLPLSAAIPKVQWRLRGAADDRANAWHDTVQDEIWLGSEVGELELVLRFPCFLEGAMAAVSIDDDGTQLKSEIHHGEAVLDLARHADTLRSGSAVKAFRLSVAASDFGIDVSESPLFTLRTRWEAVDIQCVDRSRAGKVELQLTWQEKGITEQRIVRLWRHGAQAPALVWQKVIATPSPVTISLDPREVPPGYYLVQLEACDPWGSTGVSASRATVGSHVWVYLGQGGDSLTGKRFIIDFVRKGRVPYPLSATYRLNIAGKIVNSRLPSGQAQRHVLVKRTNEGWHVAQLEVEPADDPLAAEIADANPFKVEWSDSENVVKTIEDRRGDGAMYCYECQRLFWSDETLRSEQRQNHRLVGPISAFIVREER
ncbi:MAG: hypothetical protein GXP27_10970 [Planctomycetes bacterium]|nr:hypothetical protein [Planctomycetota bacterium]